MTKAFRLLVQRRAHRGSCRFHPSLGETGVITLAGLVTGISAAFSFIVGYALKVLLGVDV